MGFPNTLFLGLIIICVALKTTFSIIRGKPAEFYPFFVLVQKNFQFCGGTIVDANIVLTAAHCVYHPDRGRWAYAREIFVLQADFTTPEFSGLTYHPCQKLRYHHFHDPTLYGGSGPFAIALIKLQQTLKMGGKAALKSCYPLLDNKERYRYGTVIGLGLTNQHPNTSSVQLMEALLQKDDSCGKHNLESGLVNPQMQICYSGSNGASTCHGDEGGPIVFKENNEVVCLIGVSTLNNQELCDHPYYPSIFIGARAFRNWMWRQILQLNHDYYS